MFVLRRMVRSFSVEHRMLSQLMAEYRRLVDRETFGDLDALMKLRQGLGHLLKAHLHGEYATLYPALIGSGDAETARIARSFEEGTVALMQLYAEHRERWTAEAVRADWAGYRDAVLSAFALLEHWIAREESELYPLVVQSEALATPFSPAV